MEAFQHKLSNFFPFDQSSSIRGKFILGLENNSGSGEFILSYFLLKLVRQQIPVFLLVTNHSKKHYESILRKNGLNFDKLLSSKHLIIRYLNLVAIEPSNEQSSSSDSCTWEALIHELNNSDSLSRYSFLIDDLDFLEILAFQNDSSNTSDSSLSSSLTLFPLHCSSRQFLSKILHSVKSTSTTSSSSNCLFPLHSLVAFGRMCVDHTLDNHHGTWSPVPLSSQSSSSFFSPSSGFSSFSSASALSTPSVGDFLPPYRPEIQAPALTEYCKYRSHPILSSPILSYRSLSSLITNLCRYRILVNHLSSFISSLTHFISCLLSLSHSFSFLSRSDLTIVASPLSSGYSSDVHGILTILPSPSAPFHLSTDNSSPSPSPSNPSPSSASSSITSSSSQLMNMIVSSFSPSSSSSETHDDDDDDDDKEEETEGEESTVSRSSSKSSSSSDVSGVCSLRPQQLLFKALDSGVRCQKLGKE